jgi:hypothetical protein
MIHPLFPLVSVMYLPQKTREHFLGLQLRSIREIAPCRLCDPVAITLQRVLSAMQIDDQAVREDAARV